MVKSEQSKLQQSFKLFMKFIKNIQASATFHQPLAMRPQEYPQNPSPTVQTTTSDQPLAKEIKQQSKGNAQFVKMEDVAAALGVSKRYVQVLAARKIIPVIRLGKRCTRFDLGRVVAAVRRYELEEIGRQWKS